MIKAEILTILAMMRFILTIVLIIMCLGVQSQAPKYSNEFLSIGVGARALGMGSAHAAASNDAFSGYWNPSGILENKSNLSIGLMHAEYFAGLANYEFGSLIAKIDKTSAVGLSYIRFGVDDIPDTSDLLDANGNIDYDRVSTFSAIDNAFLFSYAKDLNSSIKGLSVGGNVKIIKRKVGSYANAWGFGIDISGKYRTGPFTFAFVGRDITSTFNAWSFDVTSLQEVFTLTENEIPQNSVEVTLPKLVFAAAYGLDITADIKGLFEIDFDMTTDGRRNTLIAGDVLSLDPKFGSEFSYKEMVYLRIGTKNYQKVLELDGSNTSLLEPSFGVGLKLKDARIDYALSNIGSGSVAPISHIFSINLGINKK